MISETRYALCVKLEHIIRVDLLYTTIGIFVIMPINYVIIFPFTYHLPNHLPTEKYTYQCLRYALRLASVEYE